MTTFGPSALTTIGYDRSDRALSCEIEPVLSVYLGPFYVLTPYWALCEWPLASERGRLRHFADPWKVRFQAAGSTLTAGLGGLLLFRFREEVRRKRTLDSWLELAESSLSASKLKKSENGRSARLRWEQPDDPLQTFYPADANVRSGV